MANSGSTESGRKAAIFCLLKIDLTYVELSEAQIASFRCMNKGGSSPGQFIGRVQQHLRTSAIPRTGPCSAGSPDSWMLADRRYE